MAVTSRVAKLFGEVRKHQNSTGVWEIASLIHFAMRHSVLGYNL